MITDKLLVKLLIALSMGLAACDDPKDDTSAADPDGPVISGIEATPSEVIPTVLTLRWNTDVATLGQVRFGTSGELSMETPLETVPWTEHEAILVGLPPESDVSFEISAASTDGATSIATGSSATGWLTNQLPSLTVEGGGHDHFTVTTVLGAINGPAIIDQDGKIVWFYEDNRALQIFRARLTGDGEGIIYNAAQVSGGPTKDSALVKVSLDGTSEEVTPIPLLAHDFVDLPEGGYAAIVFEFRDLEGESIMGDKLVEISEDGVLTDVWSMWDCFDPAVDIGTDQEIGWAYANALDYDPDDRAYYLSIRNFSTIVKIGRDSGECEWAFGTTGATFGPEEGSATFLHEHQFEVLDDSLLVFDNAGAGGNVSRVLEYSFDPEAEQAQEIWSYISDPEIFTFVLGDVARMENGDTMVDWATGGTLDRVTPAGEVTWRVKANIGYAFGFFEQESSLYR